MKTSFNLSEWALRHRSLVWYFMAIFAVMGVASYLNLGREEDPSFTIKTMLIRTQWPGASVDEMSKQVTERIERKLEELDVLDYTKSMTMPGQDDRVRLPAGCDQGARRSQYVDAGAEHDE
jgi:multidrug efflux pump subunit AcrB